MIHFEQGPRETYYFPEGEIKIPSPGRTPQEPIISLSTLIVPAAFTALGMGMMLFVSAMQSSNSLFFLFGIGSLLMMLGSYIVTFINYRSQRNSYNTETQVREEKYNDILNKQRNILNSFHVETKKSQSRIHPNPSECLEIVKKKHPQRLWARAKYDADFLTLRVGIGNYPFQMNIKPPEQPSAMDNDPLIEKAHALKHEFISIASMPICLHLRACTAVGLSGSLAKTTNAARSLAMQIATHHSPHDVKIAVFYPQNLDDDWDWIRWLPHVWSDDKQIRFLSCDQESTRELLAYFFEEFSNRKFQIEKAQSDEFFPKWPHIVFFVIEPDWIKEDPVFTLVNEADLRLGVHTVYFADRVAGLPKYCQSIVKFESEIPVLSSGKNNLLTYEFKPDTIPRKFADEFSRKLAPIQIKYSSSASQIPTYVPLLDVLGAEKVEQLNLLERWRSNNPFDSMTVPIGKRAGGELHYLDLHERKEEPTLLGGHGPNVLVAGTVGSGKSELLQSLVLSLAVNFDPREVVFVLLDFKPPGMSSALKDLPHVVNTIDLNALNLVPRSLKSLESELERRGRLFEKVGGVTHIDKYMELYRSGAERASECLPYVILIVDEFTVLREKLPDTMKKFEQVAIRGRAFGFRMILATQRPAGVVSGQVDSNTELRLCLRVAKAEDSQELLKRDFAANLKTPGRTYFRLGQGDPPDIFVQFQSAYSGAEYIIDENENSLEDLISEVKLDGRKKALSSVPAYEKKQADTQLHAVVEHIRGQTKKAGLEKDLKKRWLPWVEPLDESIFLNSIREQKGWDGSEWLPNDRWLMPIIGEIDNPIEQTKTLLKPDLGNKGHMFICSGTPNNSRLTLRMLITSLVQDHSPEEIHIHCLDFGNSGLKMFEAFPHVGNVVQRDEKRRTHRLLSWMLEELQIRKGEILSHGVASFSELRNIEIIDKVPPALILVIDNLAIFRDDFDKIDILAQLTREGQDVGIHLILAGDRTSIDFSRILRNVKGLRLGLQLGERSDYFEIFEENFPLETYIPKDIVGRGIYKDLNLLECQIAIFEKDPQLEIFELIEPMKAAAKRLNYGQPKIIGDTLPTEVALSDFVSCEPVKTWNSQQEDTTFYVPIALDDMSLKPIGFSLTEDGPHYAITGPTEGGKTSALLSWVLALSATYPPEQIQFILLDSYRSSLAPLKELPHIANYAFVESDEVQTILENMRTVFDRRRLNKQIKAKPAIVMVIDDFEHITSSEIKKTITQHAQKDAFFGFHLLLGGGVQHMVSWDEFPKQILSNQSGILVGSRNLINDSTVFNLTLSLNESKAVLPPGRAYLINRGQYRLAQLFLPGDKASVKHWVKNIKDAMKNRTDVLEKI